MNAEVRERLGLALMRSARDVGDVPIVQAFRIITVLAAEVALMLDEARATSAPQAGSEDVLDTVRSEEAFHCGWATPHEAHVLSIGNWRLLCPGSPDLSGYVAGAPRDPARP